MAQKDEPIAFEVTLVEKKGRCGLLLKKTTVDGTRKKGYFYEKDPDKRLAPPPHIRSMCGEAVHQVGGRTDETKIFRELCHYTRKVNKADTREASVALSQTYCEQRGYPQVATRYFHRKNAPLACFIGSYQTFTKHLIEKKHGKDELVGKADRFEVCSPEDLKPREVLSYLTSAPEVLAFPTRHEKTTEESRWFRRTGAIAVDFEAGKVWDRIRDVERLERILRRNGSVVVQGPLASGKSILVRQLVYHRLKENASERIHFLRFTQVKGGHENAWDCIDDEVSKVSGHLIIEDAHLFPNKASQLYATLAGRDDLRIIVVTRPSIWRHLDPQERHLIARRPPRFESSDSSAAEYVVTEFREQHPELPWDLDHLKTFLVDCQENLWLLACLLEGYEKCKGQGTPDHWIHNSVNEYLERLGSQMPGCNPHYPRLLMAISAFSQDETPVTGAFLESGLKFPASTLQDLVRRGEVEKAEAPGHPEAMYRVSHSYLASLYWRFGTSYRKAGDGSRLPSYKDLLYHYAQSHASNNLQAILKGPEEFRAEIKSRLQDANLVATLIKKQQSVETLCDFLDFERDDVEFTDAIYQAILDRMEALDHLKLTLMAILCISQEDEQQGNDLWDRIGPTVVFEQLREEKPWGSNKLMHVIGLRRAEGVLETMIERREASKLRQLAYALIALDSVSRSASAELATALDSDKTAEMIRNCCNGMGEFVFVLTGIDSNKMDDVWDKVTAADVALRLFQPPEWVSVRDDMFLMKTGNCPIFKEVMSAVRWPEVSKEFAGKDSTGPKADFLSYLLLFHPKSAAKMCLSIDPEQIARSLVSSWDLGAAARILKLLRLIDKGKARSIFAAMRDYRSEAAENIESGTIGFPAFLKALDDVSPELSKDFLQEIDEERLADTISRFPYALETGKLLLLMASVDREKALTLCNCLKSRIQAADHPPG